MFLGNVHFMCFVASYLVFVCYFLLFAPALHYCKACFFSYFYLACVQSQDRVSCDQSTIFFSKLFFFFFLPVLLYQSVSYLYLQFNQNMTANCSDQRIIGYIGVILSHLQLVVDVNLKNQIELFPTFMLINLDATNVQKL